MQYMTHSVWKSKKNTCQTGQSVVAYLMFRTFLFCHTMAPRGNVRNKMRLLGQAVKTSPFHGGNTGSIPVGVTIVVSILTTRSIISKKCCINVTVMI